MKLIIRLNGYIQQPYDLPYSIQVIEDRGSKSVMLNHWFVQLHANELMGLGVCIHFYSFYYYYFLKKKSKIIIKFLKIIVSTKCYSAHPFRRIRWT